MASQQDSQAGDENLDFWEAQQRTNVELEAAGLYLTHLFREWEIVLTPDWLSRRVRILLELQHLAVFRPATLDLILTKMARGDENDLADIGFAAPLPPRGSVIIVRLDSSKCAADTVAALITDLAIRRPYRA